MSAVAVLRVLDDRVGALERKWETLRYNRDDGPEPPVLTEAREVHAAVAALVELARSMRACIRSEPNPFSSGWGDPGEPVEVVDTIAMRAVWEQAGAVLKRCGEDL